MSDLKTPSLTGLLDVLVEDARAAVARERDQIANESRAITLRAEEHIDGLQQAAQELGRVRGLAAEEAYQREGDVEIRTVLDGAFDRLFERFEIKVKTALETLRDVGPESLRYGNAIRTWAKAAMGAAAGSPVDVHAAPEDRKLVYDAFLAAGATDFQVHVDRDLRTGFVVRDLEGRLVLDRRPEAILAHLQGDLRELLRSRMPEAPTSDRGA